MTTETKPAVDAGALNSAAATPAAAAATPTTVEVEIGGVKHKVDPAIAAAMKASADAATEAATKAAEATAQLDEVRKKLPKEAPTTAEPGDDLDTLLFTNPKEALSRVKEEAKAEIRAEYQQSEAQKTFWSNFYEANPDLVGCEMVVRSVSTRDFASLRDLSVEKAAEKIAENAVKELLKMGVTKKSGKKAPVSEGGTERTPRKSDSGNVSESSRPPVSLSSIIKDRQKNRANAQRQTRAAT